MTASAFIVRNKQYYNTKDNVNLHIICIIILYVISYCIYPAMHKTYQLLANIAIFLRSFASADNIENHHNMYYNIIYNVL